MQTNAIKKDDYYLACEKYYIYELLISKGIKAELINEVRCEAEMTKEQFEVLAASNSLPDEYAFGLSSGEYLTDDEA